MDVSFPTTPHSDTPLLRIGEVAVLTDLTPRTIRWWERLGLLHPARRPGRGSHRLFDEADVERLRWIARVREVLGLSLEELAELFTDQSVATAVLDRGWDDATPLADRVRMVDGAFEELDRQLLVVARRARQLAELEAELTARRRVLETTRVVG